MEQFKIVAIVQIYNEIEKENLYRFFKYLKPIVSEIVVFDDCSTDGSYEYAKSVTEFVLRGKRNDFSDEVNHRQAMINKALSLNPDFILSLDADEVLSANSKESLQELCAQCIKEGLDGIEFKCINLWRSGSWRRVDSLFDDGWFVKLWKVKPEMLMAKTKKGLHQKLFPESIKITKRQALVSILHYGFASKKNLAYKYLVYKRHGQKGYVMLDRLIKEDALQLELVPASVFPSGLRVIEEEPNKIPFIDALTYVSEFKPEVLRPRYSIACLIYKSIGWLDFVYEQVLKYTPMNDVEFFFIANDADQEIINYLKANYIRFYEFTNTESQKKEWYINNVYRAYNYAVKVAKGDFVVLINSDMCFTPGWFEALKGAYNGNNLVSSRLVESGKLRTGKYGIEKNFGHTYQYYEEQNFLDFAASIKNERIEDGGLYMPLFFNKRHFQESGGYPEGNLKIGADILSNDVALPAEQQVAGDTVLMERMSKIGIKHQTAMSSVVYHFQCGEKDDENNDFTIASKKVRIAICNDNCSGLMGERVLWNYLLDNIEGSYPLDTKVVGKQGFRNRAQDYIETNFPETDIVIQNATFIDKIHPTIYTITFLQDNLRGMKDASSQQETNLKLSNSLVTNSIQTSLSYPEYNFEIIPVGVDSELFSPKPQSDLRRKYGFSSEKIGIFVGSFSEVKGWSKVVNCINSYPDITWILVSKYQENFEAKNVKVFNRVNQNILSELLNCADFFIIGSPVETQCLAALEANLCDLPVVMPLTGIYKDFSVEDQKSVGVFGEDLVRGVSIALSSKFDPRDKIIQKKLTVEYSIEEWRSLIFKSIQDIRINRLINVKANVKPSIIKIAKFKCSFYARNFLIKYVLGESYWALTDLMTYSGSKAFLRKILFRLGVLNFVKKLIGRS